ncbi:MAG TPA: cytochrome b/b6 domain-containing protein [Steroidobacteraceae bacterium]|nr:cytochrome b/b6 domain-containing protein [Steroidobacteraceae bacterium]
MPDDVQPSRTRVRVWDAPTRLFHWLMVIAVAICWWTGDSGRLEWHRWTGYFLLGLLVFRLYWGFVGGSTARFGNFLRGPRAVLEYLRGRAAPRPGHNPLGAMSVLVLLGLLLAQVVLGLFAVDVDGIESGPLSLYVSFEAGRTAAHWHHRVFDALLWLIALHVLAIAWYLVVRKDNLIAAMFHGTHEYPGAPQPLRSVAPWRLVVGAMLAGVVTWLVARAFQF